MLRVVEEGIACDSSNFWLHFKRSGINKDKTNINRIHMEEYIRIPCNNDLLYEDRNSNKTFCQFRGKEDIHINYISFNANAIEQSFDTEEQFMANYWTNPSAYDTKGKLGHLTLDSSTTCCPDFSPPTTYDTVVFKKQIPMTTAINVKVIKTKSTNRASKTKDEKEDIIINQKTRIFILENEINQLKL
ncbi:unnamed protein product [Mytilus edulis]|uniref:Uncharacterized protein n=1 Tax=Mytilus edulis TaxID=6550 RepID=A0A8S3UY96_MYTED|nr:unnamed protein product [Mytilus edulis]